MWRSFGTCALLALVVGTAVHAETRQAEFQVRVTVPPRISLAVVEEPGRLDLTPADIARGFVDVSARYRVQSNTRRGWLLHLAPRSGLADRIEVRGLASTVVLIGDGVELYRAAPAGGEEFALDYRVVLSPDARPGRYALPVHLSATLL